MKRFFINLALISLSTSLFAAINTKYQQGYELQSVNINTEAKEHSMSLFKDNSIIYLKDNTVYVVGVDAEGNLETPVVSEELTNLGIRGTVAYDEKTQKIYFAKQDNGKESSELYESTFKEGKWSEPKKIIIEGLGKVRGNESFITNAGWSYASKPVINFINPTIAKDGKRIYFTSNSLENGKGGKDIWYIDQKDETTWSYPVNAGENINTAIDEDFAFIDNAENMYFASNSDIKVSKASGESWEAGKNMEQPYNSASNDYNLIVKSGTPFLISDRKAGNGDDIFAFVKLPEPKPEPVVVVVPEPEPVKEFHWTLFLFDFDKDILKNEFKVEFDSLVAQMKEFPGARFEIAGNTDSRGSDSYNDNLSLRRANTIKNLLVKEGFKEEQFVVVGHGEKQPTIAKPKNEKEHALNRRVEVKIINSNK